MAQLSHQFVALVAKENHLRGLKEALRFAKDELLPLRQIHAAKSLGICRVEDF
jgi:hypothetical protein